MAELKRSCQGIHVSTKYVKEKMRVNFIGKLIKRFSV